MDDMPEIAGLDDIQSRATMFFSDHLISEGVSFLSHGEVS
jgi:hypothetical protein